MGYGHALSVFEAEAALPGVLEGYVWWSARLPGRPIVSNSLMHL